MKKLSFLIAFCWASSINAQSWELAPELSVNLLPVESGQFGLTAQPGFSGGAYVRYRLNDNWSFRSGVYFTQKRHAYAQVDSGQINLFGQEDQILGLENVDLSTYEYTNGSVSQYYLELPILAEFNWSSFNVFLGPYLGYQLFARSRIEEISEAPALRVIDLDALDPDGQLSAFLPDPYSYSFRESSSKSGLNDWDLGVRTGAGLKVNRLAFSAAYNFGMLPFRSDNASLAFNAYHYAQFSVAYVFTLRKKV